MDFANFTKHEWWDFTHTTVLDKDKKKIKPKKTKLELNQTRTNLKGPLFGVKNWPNWTKQLNKSHARTVSEG